MHCPLQPVPAPRHSSCVHSIMLKNSNAESCTSSSKICQERMQSLHFAVRRTKMEWGYNSPKHCGTGQWQDRNRTLEPDSWAWLWLLITLSTTVPSISIDFKLTHTHILSRTKRSNQEGSLCSSPLEANMILRETFSASSPSPKHSRLGGTKQAPSRNYQMLIKCSKPLEQLFKKHRVQSQHAWNAERRLQMQMLLLLHLTMHLPPYHLILWCQDLRVNPRWLSLTVSSDFMLAFSSSLPTMSWILFTTAANLCEHKTATSFPCLLE